MSFQPKHDAADHVEPRKERSFLKHHEPVPAGLQDRLVAQPSRALSSGLFEAGNDIEQGRFSAAARPDQASEPLPRRSPTRCYRARGTSRRLLRKPLRNVFHGELGRRRSLGLPPAATSGFSEKLREIGRGFDEPGLKRVLHEASMEARGVSAVNVMRFHDCAMRSGATSLLACASSSALINFWASSGFFAIQSVSAACAFGKFPLPGRAVPEETLRSRPGPWSRRPSHRPELSRRIPAPTARPTVPRSRRHRPSFAGKAGADRGFCVGTTCASPPS